LGEIAGVQNQPELGLSGRRGRRIRDDFGDRPPVSQDLSFFPSGSEKVAAGGCARSEHDSKEGNEA